MNVFAIITALTAVSALFSYINARWIRLPGVIGVMLLSMITAVLTLVAGKSFPIITNIVHDLDREIDFSKALLDVLLGFLLFASALHFDVNRLREGLRSVLTISTVGVIISTLLFAGMMFELAPLLGVNLPMIYCLLFGALVSPTDAVAVAALLKKSKMPARLETIISGESLFNDGIGLVLFVTFLELAQTPDKSFHLQEVAMLFATEVFGGLVLGAVTGWIAYRLMRSIDDFQTVVLLSLTLVMSISAIGSALHVSVPLAVVAAGLLVGSHPVSKDPDSPINDYLGRIWKVLDDLLNTMLFVLIGLQLVSIKINNSYLLIGAVGIVILLLARALSIILPVMLLKRTLHLRYNSITILTWGGLRGGISVALALSLPESPYRPIILGGSFVIVVFSVMVQGLTLNKLVNRLLGSNPA